MSNHVTKTTVLEDDSKESVSLLLERRVPWLAVGLIGGVAATLLGQHFEKVLASNLQLAFFIPFIVYMADAVGTQTQTIYTRNLSRGRVRLSTYIIKELCLGIIIGAVFGAAVGGFTYIWFHSLETTLAVSLAMFVNIAIAPMIGLLVPTILQKEHTDPAVGGGPFTTVLQDFLSLLIYFSIASLIIFS